LNMNRIIRDELENNLKDENKTKDIGATLGK
jgi:hypothetical protein